MTKINTDSNIWKLLAITFAVLLLPTTGFNLQVNGQAANLEEENVYTSAIGTLEVTKTVLDGFMHVKYTYTSEDIHKKYGFQQIVREETHSLKPDESHVSETEVKTDVKFDLIHENESAKLEKHQKIKNKGLPMHIHQQWKAVIPESTSTVQGTSLIPVNTVQNTNIAPLTHVPKWSGKDQTVWAKYDPIDLIWDRLWPAPPSILINDVTSLMTNNGWHTSCTASDLFVLIGTTWKKQDRHVFKTAPLALPCTSQDHVRLWSINNDRVIGAAHKEYFSLSSYDIKHRYISDGTFQWERGVIPGHVVDDFELGETSAKNTFTGKTCWSTSGNSHSMSNQYTREYYNIAGILVESGSNNGLATTIAKGC